MLRKHKSHIAEQMIDFTLSSYFRTFMTLNQLINGKDQENCSLIPDFKDMWCFVWHCCGYRTHRRTLSQGFWVDISLTSHACFARQFHPDELVTARYRAAQITELNCMVYTSYTSNWRTMALDAFQKRSQTIQCVSDFRNNLTLSIFMDTSFHRTQINSIEF